MAKFRQFSTRSLEEILSNSMSRLIIQGRELLASPYDQVVKGFNALSLSCQGK